MDELLSVILLIVVYAIAFSVKGKGKKNKKASPAQRRSASLPEEAFAGQSARAVAKNPEIYIFDDSFSALDYATDYALRSALKEASRESTVIIVAQRISTVLNADRIIVLDSGRVAGMGTHKELMESCEVYRQIALSQLSEKEAER